VRGESRAPEFTVELDQRIGSIDDSLTTLTVVGDILVGPGNTVIVSQPQERVLKVFDVSGKRVGIIGRGGQGPGEFGTVSGIGWRDADIYVLDAIAKGERNVHFFAPTGALKETVRYKPTALESDTVPAPVIGFLRGGNIVASPTPGSVQPPVHRLPVVIADQDGHVIKPIGHVTRRRTSIGMVGNGASVSIGLGPADSIDDSPLTVIDPGGEAVSVVTRQAAKSAAPAEYRIVQFTHTGEVAWERIRPYTPRRLPERLIGAYLVDAAMDVLESGRTSVPYSREAVIERMQPIDFFPPVMRARAGVDRTLWVLENQVAGDTLTWTVFDARGSHVRSVRMPRKLQLLVGGPTHVWGTEQDADDVPYIVRYALRPAAPP